MPLEQELVELSDTSVQPTPTNERMAGKLTLTRLYLHNFGPLADLEQCIRSKTPKPEPDGLRWPATEIQGVSLSAKLYFEANVFLMVAESE